MIAALLEMLGSGLRRTGPRLLGLAIAEQAAESQAQSHDGRRLDKPDCQRTENDHASGVVITMSMGADGTWRASAPAPDDGLVWESNGDRSRASGQAEGTPW